MSYKWTNQASVNCPGSEFFSLVPLKADLQAPVCFSEEYDDDLSFVPIKDARSDNYAPGT
jgi:hypothetical protein